MATLTNSFEGGTSGTTISTGNSGGNSGNAFDVVAIGATGAVAFDSTHAAHGALSAKVSTGGTADQVLMEWTTSEGTQVTIYFRVYLYMTSNSVAVAFFEVRAGASTSATISVTTGGKIQFLNGAFAAVQTFTASVPLNQWVRVEGSVTGSAAAGVISASQYNSMDSAVATETHTVTSQNTTGSLTQYWFGQCSTQASTPAFWLDNIGISTAGALGPAGKGGGAGAHIVPALKAAGII